ncbi:MAG: hypothetical protein KJ847_01440 [Firmicutes bacterium]|nr:hypothetical protein [Bacillota bacterium]
MDKLMKLIDQQIKTQKKVIIAIDGPCTSGKSTLGKMLEYKYSALLFHTDDYFLHPDRKTKERLEESGGNVDYERIYTEIFANIDQEYIVSNHFNCTTNKLEQRNPVKNNQVIIVEGTYSLHHSLYDQYTLRLYLDIDPKLQIERIQKRNGDKLLSRFINEWIPLENNYFETENLKEQVDYILKLNI